MTVEEYIRQVDNGKEIVSYRTQELQRTHKGSAIIGRTPISMTASLDHRDIVGPVQVIRRPGLGDKMFALSATHAHVRDNPDVDVTFSGYDKDLEWLKTCIKWCNVGLNQKANTVVNLDNLPMECGDRATGMATAMRTKIDDFRFPFVVPGGKLVDFDYFVFAPFSSRWGPRSLPKSVVKYVIEKTHYRIIFVTQNIFDVAGNSKCINMTGPRDLLETFRIIKHSKGIIGCDSGLIWVAAAMGIPQLCFYSHVPSYDRNKTVKNQLSVDSPVRCAPCGDKYGHLATCWDNTGEHMLTCIKPYTAQYVLHMMDEFNRIVNT